MFLLGAWTATATLADVPRVLAVMGVWGLLVLFAFRLVPPRPAGGACRHALRWGLPLAVLVFAIVAGGAHAMGAEDPVVMGVVLAAVAVGSVRQDPREPGADADRATRGWPSKDPADYR